MKSSEQQKTKNTLEWSVFGISLLLVLATFGMLIAAAFNRPETPARLTVTTGEPSFSDGRTDIPVTVKNAGGAAATDVDVRVRIGAGAALQEAGFTLDFVPRDASRKGTVSFQNDLRSLVPECRIVGYAEP